MLFLLLVGIAFSSETIQVVVAPAESLVVTVSGEGPSVVMLPGLFGSGYSYRHVRDILDREGFRSISIEPLGMGGSSRPPEADYSLMAQSERVTAVLDTLGIEAAYFIGHSHGASIAMRVAYRHPERVLGIVSIEGGPADALMSSGMRTAMRFAPMLRLVNGRTMLLRRILHDMRESSADPQWVTRDLVLHYVAGMANDFGSTMEAYRAMARAEEPELLSDHLAEVRAPIILLLSETRHDVGIPSEEILMLEAGVRSFRVDTIPQTGFFIQEEQPEGVVSALHSLFDEAP
jgi:pimeloyl-ACP methyl ester carboxylesterase